MSQADVPLMLQLRLPLMDLHFILLIQLLLEQDLLVDILHDVVADFIVPED